MSSYAVACRIAVPFRLFVVSSGAVLQRGARQTRAPPPNVPCGARHRRLCDPNGLSDLAVHALRLPARCASRQGVSVIS